MDHSQEPVLGQVPATWRDEHIVLTLPDGTELAYTLEECGDMFTVLYQQRRFLAGATSVVIPFPDASGGFLLSGERAVLLATFIRGQRQAKHIPDPPDIMAH